MKCGNLANLHDPAMYAERVEPCSDYIIDYCCKNSPTYLGGWEAHVTPAIYMRGLVRMRRQARNSLNLFCLYKHILLFSS